MTMEVVPVDFVVARIGLLVFVIMRSHKVMTTDEWCKNKSRLDSTKV